MRPMRKLRAAPRAASCPRAGANGSSLRRTADSRLDKSDWDPVSGTSRIWAIIDINSDQYEINAKKGRPIGRQVFNRQTISADLRIVRSMALSFLLTLPLLSSTIITPVRHCRRMLHSSSLFPFYSSTINQGSPTDCSQMSFVLLTLLLCSPTITSGELFADDVYSFHFFPFFFFFLFFDALALVLGALGAGDASTAPWCPPPRFFNSFFDGL